MAKEKSLRICNNRSAAAAAAAAKSRQSCPTLCDPIDSSPAGLSVPGILQARILEWVAISFSNAWKWKLKVKLLGRVRLLATPWTAAYQAPPSTGFSRQEYWSGVPLSICLSCCKWYYFILLNDWVVFHCIYVSHLVYPFIFPWTFRLLLCPGYYKQCFNEHWSTILSDRVFLWIYAQKIKSIGWRGQRKK